MSENHNEITNSGEIQLRSSVVDKINKYPLWIIAALAFLIYFQTFFFDFVKLDDIPILRFNQEYFNDISNISDAFTRDAFVQEDGAFYRPLQTVTFIIETNIAGGEPYIFHITNVILHIITSIGVFLLFRKLNFRGYVPFLSGLLYAVHPLFTHAVSWIPARNDLLITIFCIYGFLFFVEYINKARVKYLILHFLMLLFALFSKETAAVFPAICLLYIVLFNKKMLWTNRTYIPFAGWVILIAFWFIVRMQAVGMIWNEGEFGFMRLLMNSPVIPELIAKLFIPFFIIVLSTFKIWTAGAGLILIAAFIYYLIKSRKNDLKYIYFGIAWFVLLIIPGTMYSHFHSEFFYDYLDHRAYLPMIGVIIVLADIIPSAWLNLKNKKPFVIILILFLFYAGYSAYQARNYTDPISFWTSAANSNPRVAGFHLVLGELLLRSDRFDEAERQFLISMKYQPDVVDSYCYLGEIYDKQKRHARAVNVLNMAVKVDSDNFFAWKTMAKNYLILKMPDKAAEAYKKAHAIKPDNQDIIQKLVIALTETNSFTEALTYLNKLSKNKSDFREEFYFKWAEAIPPADKERILEKLDKAISMNNNAQNYNRAGIILMQANHQKEAMAYWQKAMELNPNDINLLQNLMQYHLAFSKNIDKAKEYAQRIRELGGKINPQIQSYLNEN